jgi:hypothetical protein
MLKKSFKFEPVKFGGKGVSMLVDRQQIYPVSPFQPMAMLFRG